MFHKRAIVSLVHKEARLLTFQPVNMESQSILMSHIITALSIEEAVFLTKLSLEGKRCLALVIDGFEALPHHFFESFGQFLSANMHTYAVSLHDGS